MQAHAYEYEYACLNMMNLLDYDMSMLWMQCFSDDMIWCACRFVIMLAAYVIMLVWMLIWYDVYDDDMNEMMLYDVKYIQCIAEC